MSHLFKPKLRNVIDIQRTIYQNEPVFVLQDNLKLTEAAILLPQYLGPLAVLCNGQRTVPEIKADLKREFDLNLSQVDIENLVAQFDEALLLEGATFDQAKREAVKLYRAKPHRESSLAGVSYPANPAALKRQLKSYVDRVGQVKPSSADSRAIISPHIDYPRGGEVYAKVWTSATEAVRQAELVIVIGTDHKGSFGAVTLTPQHYATPLGVLPTELELVDKLAQVIGYERAYTEEIHHRDEWSIELDLVWLQFIRGNKPVPIIPILAGSFRHFMLDEAEVEQDRHLTAFVEALREIMAQRRTLIVASGDLAHLGPYFDTAPVDSAGFARMERDDTALLETLSQGSARQFLDFMHAGQHERNVCGLSPFWFTLSALEKSKGQLIAYDRCPVPGFSTSFVSVCGLVWE